MCFWHDFAEVFIFHFKIGTQKQDSIRNRIIAKQIFDGKEYETGGATSCRIVRRSSC